MIDRINESFVRLTVRDEDGQGLTEYALILMLAVIVVVASLSLLGPKVANVFNNVNNSL
ncbi:MAG TPA: hypothetical protein VF960_15760 [Chloroflexota bacterium]